MKFGSLVLALIVTASPMIAFAQDAGLASDEQILLKQVMTDRKAVFAKNLGQALDRGNAKNGVGA